MWQNASFAHPILLRKSSKFIRIYVQLTFHAVPKSPLRNVEMLGCRAHLAAGEGESVDHGSALEIEHTGA